MLHTLKTRAFACFDKHAWWFQGKRLVAVAAAKRHMVVMSSDGDIYTWGHRVVTPRRVQLAGETLQVSLCSLICSISASCPHASLFPHVLNVFYRVHILGVWLQGTSDL